MASFDHYFAIFGLIEIDTYFNFQCTFYGLFEINFLLSRR